MAGHAQYEQEPLAALERQRQVALRAQALQARQNNISARQQSAQAMAATPGANKNLVPKNSEIANMSDADWLTHEQRFMRDHPGAEVSPAKFHPDNAPAAPAPTAAPATTVTAPANAPTLAALPAAAPLTPADAAQRSMMGDLWRGKADAAKGIISRPGDAARIANKYGGDSTTKANAEPGYYGADGKYLGAASYDQAGNVTSQMPKGATGFVGRGATPTQPAAAVATNFPANTPVTPIGTAPVATDPLSGMPAPTVAPLSITTGQRQNVAGVKPNLDLTSSAPAFDLPPPAPTAANTAGAAVRAVLPHSFDSTPQRAVRGELLPTMPAGPDALVQSVKDFGAGFMGAGQSGVPGTNPAPAKTITPTTPAAPDELDRDYLRKFGAKQFDGF